jgi:hypothetical protein
MALIRLDDYHVGALAAKPIHMAVAGWFDVQRAGNIRQPG